MAGSRRRVWYRSSGDKEKLIIQRLYCKTCEKIHHELPDVADPLAKNLAGNYIVIKHADNEYSLLAHLKPNSVVVREGEHVKRHQKIGHCGNTGNTTEPHLHFQIQTGENLIFSAGIPICFDDINIASIPNYHLFDHRETKMPTNVSIEDGQLINRGFLVENK